MLADTYTLNGVVFTKRSSDEVGGARYTDGSSLLNLKTLRMKYVTDRKGVQRILVDLSTNVADMSGTKIGHTRRSYLNVVRTPEDTDATLADDLTTLVATTTNTTLRNLILAGTV